MRILLHSVNSETCCTRHNTTWDSLSKREFLLQIFWRNAVDSVGWQTPEVSTETCVAINLTDRDAYLASQQSLATEAVDLESKNWRDQIALAEDFTDSGIPFWYGLWNWFYRCVLRLNVYMKIYRDEKKNKTQGHQRIIFFVEIFANVKRFGVKTFITYTSQWKSENRNVSHWQIFLQRK